MGNGRAGGTQMITSERRLQLDGGQAQPPDRSGTSPDSRPTASELSSEIIRVAAGEKGTDLASCLPASGGSAWFQQVSAVRKLSEPHAGRHPVRCTGHAELSVCWSRQLPVLAGMGNLVAEAPIPAFHLNG
jgi:hypothetical protein